jgi:serine protease Do
MSTRKTTLFYAFLIAVASLAIGMVLASRMELAPQSSAQTFAPPPMNSAPLGGPVDAETFRNIAREQTPMVVNISTERRQRPRESTESFGGEDLFRRFFGQPAPQDRVRVAAGTGFIINREGYILTNNHVVEGATQIWISLYGDEEQRYPGRVVGRDPLTDSALLQLAEKPDHDLPEARFGDSTQMQPGDWVMAIGNPFGLAHTVSVGVISSTERAFTLEEGRPQDMLQTDAAINPGNSGGPLLNLRGEVIGINTAIFADQARGGGNIGIGFAIPINVVRVLLPQLHTGKVIRGRIGVSIAAVPADSLAEFGLTERRGALVSTVAPDGPARRAGLQPGDVIVRFSDRPVEDSDALVKMVVETKPGTTVPLLVLRDKQEQTLNVTVEELDLDVDAGRRREAPDEAGVGFGWTLSNVTPAVARQLRLPQGRSGVVITEVDPTGPAATAGLVPGTVILEVNRNAVANVSEARRELQRVAAGGRVFLLVWQGGQEPFVSVRRQ